ncbi:MAG TPA: hypothetical protein DCL48_12265, partial [Alphaproteobacteria bacterium]|nr:hypothetical protein [Alphaproteobacteria bacterium]
GVPSRMNVGQILETHLGWACRGLGRQVGDTLEKVQRDGKFEPLRKQMKAIYGAETDLADLPDTDLVTAAQQLTGGVAIATPVFDGAREDDINKMLEAAGLSKSGQVKLYDGRSGEP